MIPIHSLGASSLALLILFGWTFQARADAIDEKLYRFAPRIVKNLRERGYRNVGVLKFQLQIGNKPPTFAGGRLNTNLATRLENALILELKENDPLGITRGAALWAAQQDRSATYLTADGKKKLFDLKYPLCWGGKEVAVDAFLTGIIRLPADMQQTTIAVVFFDKKKPDAQSLGHFSVRTDRGLLADLGLNFCLNQRFLTQMQRELDLDKVEQEAVYDAHQRKTSLGLKAWPEDDLIELKLKSAGQTFPLVPHTHSNFGPALKLPSQETFTLLVRNKQDQRLGLVLRVHGKSVLQEEKSDREVWRSAMLVLEPNKEYTLRGYYGKSPGKVQPFKVLPSPADAGPLGSNFGPGLVELHLFREGGKGPSIERLVQERTIALRAVTHTEATIVKLQEQIRKAMNPRAVAAREFLLVGPEANDLREVALTNPIHAGALYFTCKGGK